ncbi:hypothetical protein SD71_21160 [Cohnella kolymensis]|uniref:Uncharacterized protein n=1 Tax=Cohnella kolymensis TaxID=1590652 RepID=A0ABR5A0I9_9BACL|nr:hypothetical protein [Cohnella kolymensis]KIL34178.1 hypothetical protein SD71_21160 [Cohnella kolymensis]
MLIRILSLYTMIKGLEHLINIVQILYPYYFMNVASSFSLWGIVFLAFITGALFLVLGLFVWIKTAWIANLVVGNEQFTQEKVAAIKESQLYTLGLTLVGTFVFIESLPVLISLFGQLIQLSTTDFADSFEDQRDKVWLQIGVTIFKLALSLALVLRARGVAHVIRKIRS